MPSLPSIDLLLSFLLHLFDTMLGIMPCVQFRPIADLLRSIPRHEMFGSVIEGLTFIMEKQFQNSSPLKENPARMWTFYASERIYSRTGDVISGSLACAVLISFLICRHETPLYVFLVWAILAVVLCLIL